MATTAAAPDSAAPVETQLDSGSYEIIRSRLQQYGQELRSRLEQLNAARRDVFGSIETALVATERITTQHNCVPRDLAALKSRFLFGYNVRFGLKATTEPGDVLGLFELRDGVFHELSLDGLRDPQFLRDFGEIYRYYKNAAFLRFFVEGAHLFMVFQVGRTASDIKTLKWQLAGDELVYLDNRSDHEVRLPPQHEFQWVRTTRDQHRFGAHPHIAIEDRLFVETIGGDLTIKVENNTDSGEGIYSEEVRERDQTLDDAEIYYAVVGNLILLRIRPYNEPEFRHIVFNAKTQQARRWDGLRHAAILLPDDHGLIFPNGYYLQTGDCKTFDNVPADLVFERRVAAPNGEDFLYCFRNYGSGEVVLLQYNMIEQQVTLPLICHGATVLHGGELICFKRQDEPQRHHALQVWRTPYVSDLLPPPTADTDSLLYKVGNRDIVRGMAECQAVLSLIGKEDSYANLYVDLTKLCGDIIDSYFWINRPETMNLAEPLLGIKETAAAAVEQFEKVVRARRSTAQATRAMQQQVADATATIHRRRFDSIDQFVSSLTDLRRLRGETIGLRELRYVDLPLVDRLEKQVAEEADRLSHRCVEFLLRPDALQPYEQQIAAQSDRIDGLQTVVEARQLDEQITGGAAELEMLIDVVSNLKIDDATQRTAIIDDISALFARLNHARSRIKSRTKELQSVEGAAEFHAQLKLMNQSVVNYLELCDTPQRCDELLTKLAIQVEELEGRFAEFDEFVVQLAEKREEIYSAFEARKLALVEARNRRATALMSAAERILKGIKARLEALPSVSEINSYLAADLMVEKVRDIVRQLTELNDSVKVDDIQSRLKALREDAVRQLRDRQDLYVAGENTIQLGRHRFSVNSQPLDVTLVARDDQMQLHLTGTNFFEPIADPALDTARDLWSQEIVSENHDVYRGEYLAYQLLQSIDTPHGPALAAVLRMTDDERLDWVRRFMGPRYQEGYLKGVHDADAALLVRALAEVRSLVGLLQYHPTARAMAIAYWRYFCEPQEKSRLSALLRGHSAVIRYFPRPEQRAGYVRELAGAVADFAAETQLFDATHAGDAAEYLYAECVRDVGFAISRIGAQLHEDFHARLRSQQGQDAFQKSLDSVRQDPVTLLRLARDWAQAFLGDRDTAAAELMYADEFAVLLLEGKLDTQKIVDGQLVRSIRPLAGSHRLVEHGAYELNYNAFSHKLSSYARDVVPRFQRLSQRKRELIEDARQRLKLSEFQPKVLTSFVRNKLIDAVYLPLIGDNLAKQIGAAGDQKRAERMGLLLLVSPPGYGKTTLMEYLASRLGLVFMKINGPAIGHRVTSLDPSEATNAAAREELEKLNLALEMGDNIMLYVDDIQHCHTELLQKFISLCDAQRKIEGVYRGHTRTYDLRGRRVAVVMAGNPYTESGERFQIPDMLSNRADIYNLGEIIGDTQDVFELSYLENAMTSNPTLARIASRHPQDIYPLVKIAETGERSGVDLEGNYSPDELSETVSVIQKLLRVRDVVLSVNRQYIRSAAQADEYRTEPPFKLQGSYRNMNRIAEKVVPMMNDEELQRLVVANYENDAQTLTSDTEANLLKFKQLMGILTAAEQQRWDDICRTFRQNVKLHGVGADDKAGLVIAQLGSVTDGLEAIRKAVGHAAGQWAEHERSNGTTEKQLQTMAEDVAQLRSLFAARLTQDVTRAAPASGPAAEGVPAYDAVDSPLSKIVVQHKVPRSILAVVQQQFELMHAWFGTLQQNSTQQTAEMSKLQQSVESCLASYQRLLAELEAARKDH